MRDRKRWIGPFTTLTPAGRAVVDVNRMVQSEKFQRDLEILRRKLIKPDGLRQLEPDDSAPHS